MKQQAIVLFVVVYIHIIFVSVDAQHFVCPIQKIDNKEFYLYSVEVGEGLFAVGRKFAVSVGEIEKANPTIKNGLKVGQRILVPVNKKQQKDTVQHLANNDFVAHTVVKKQTIFGIAKKYGISQTLIQQYNPSVVSGLKEGMVLRIPITKTITSIKTDTARIATNNLPIDTMTHIDNLGNTSKKSIKIAYLLPFMLENSKDDATNEKFIDFYAGALLAMQEAKKKGISVEIFTYDTEKSEEKIRKSTRMD